MCCSYKHLTGIDVRRVADHSNELVAHLGIECQQPVVRVRGKTRLQRAKNQADGAHLAQAVFGRPRHLSFKTAGFVGPRGLGIPSSRQYKQVAICRHSMKSRRDKRVGFNQVRLCLRPNA